MSRREHLSGVEEKLGRVLRVGVTLSTSALAGGLVASLALGNRTIASELLTFGILMLIATPFARVVVSTILYAFRRDWTFVLLTLVVLGELIASLVAALRR
jgi:uncharacterized membrane protein